MTVPPEETLEAETGFDYGHSHSFDYGLLDVTPTIFAQPIELELGVLGPDVSGDGAVPIDADTIKLELDPLGPDVSADGSAGIDADTIKLELDVLPIDAHYAISPPPIELDLSIGEPWFEAGDWIIDNRIIRSHAGFEVSATTVRLTFNVGSDDIDHWRQYDRAGDVSVEVGYGGAFEAIGRSDTEPAVVVPPTDDKPPLDGPTEWVVESYGEDQLGVGRYQITLDLHRVEPREAVFGEPSESDDWTITTDHGTIGLEAWQVGPTGREGGASGGDLDLTLRLTDTQAAAIADAAVVPDAVVDRPVPGGQDFAIDTSDGQQTVGIDAPSDADIDDGEYLAREWELTEAGRDGERWLVDVTLARPQK